MPITLDTRCCDIVVRYDDRSDDQLEALAHERAFERNTEFRVERRDGAYCAAFKSYTGYRALAIPSGVVQLAGEANTRREAVTWLLETDDLARRLGLP